MMRSALKDKRFAIIIFLLFASVILVKPALADVMPLDDSWVVLDEFMSVEGYFQGPWTWDSPIGVVFTITDLYAASDRFKVYDSGIPVLTTPSVPDWPSYASEPSTSPPFTDDPDSALSSGYFSKGTIVFSPGSHSITIQDIHIPPAYFDDAGNPVLFDDGTVAFKASPLAVPEPATILLISSGLIGLVGLRRKLKR